MAAGRGISDGIIGPGLDIEEAHRALHANGEDEAADDGLLWLDEVDSGYGCNMAVRLAPARANNCRFDERLPLYGWLEEISSVQRRSIFRNRSFQEKRIGPDIDHTVEPETG